MDVTQAPSWPEALAAKRARDDARAANLPDRDQRRLHAAYVRLVARCTRELDEGLTSASASRRLR